MLLFFEIMVRGVLIIMFVIQLGFGILFKFNWNYWKKRGVPGFFKPWQLIKTILATPAHGAFYIKHQYDIGKSLGYEHAGTFLFTRPCYIPFSLEYIKNIMQKDFNYFSERGVYYNERDDPISANLFTLGGDKWRILRAKLSPAYTPKKIREIFDNLLQCAFQMRDAMEENYERKLSVDLKEFFECFTIDSIGSCAFGLDCNSFKDPEAEFKKEGQRAHSISFLRALKLAFCFCNPKLAQRLGITLFADSNKFFINVIKNSRRDKENHSNSKRNFIDLLFELGDEHKTHLTTEELAAQLFIFFIAGYESSSITLTFCLYELAVNQTIQNKLREEINLVMEEHGGNITYDAIMDMKYLHQVLQVPEQYMINFVCSKETSRKYPSAGVIPRQASKDYKIPGTECVIEKGVLIGIPVLALHHDPEYYPDPDNFDPERFSDENNQQRKNFTYMPFGEGPRICIGLRFGLMQIKVGLVMLLKDYTFSLNKKTQIPVEMDLFSLTLRPKNKIYLDVEKVVQ